MRTHNGSRLNQKLKLPSNINLLDQTSQVETLETAELVKLGEAAKISGFSTSYLRATAQRGRLWAVKKDQRWFTTLAAVEDYKRTRYQVVKHV